LVEADPKLPMVGLKGAGGADGRGVKSVTEIGVWEILGFLWWD